MAFREPKEARNVRSCRLPCQKAVVVTVVLLVALAVSLQCAAPAPSAEQTAAQDAGEKAREALERAKEASQEGTPDSGEGQQTTDRGDVINPDGDVNIAPDQTVQGDVVAIGGTAHVRGKVTGNVVSAGGSIHLYKGSSVGGDAIAMGGTIVRDEGAEIGGSSVKISAPWAADFIESLASGASVGEPRGGSGKDMVAFGEAVEVEANEVVEGTVSVFGAPARIKGTVNGDVVSFGGPIEIEGLVRGAAVSFGGGVRLRAGSKVNGDVVTMGGPVDREAGAEVGGEVIAMTGPWGFLGKAVSGWHRTHARLIALACWFSWSLGLLILTTLIVLLLPRHTDVIATRIVEEPGRTALWGLVGWLLVLPILVILCILVVTLAVVPFYIALVAALAVIGAVGVYVVIGRGVARLLNWQVGSVLGLALIGLAVLRVVDLSELLPLGGLITFVVSLAVLLFGLGGALMTGFGTDPTGTWLGRRLSARASEPALVPAAATPSGPPPDATPPDGTPVGPGDTPQT